MAPRPEDSRRRTTDLSPSPRVSERAPLPAKDRKHLRILSTFLDTSLHPEYCANFRSREVQKRRGPPCRPSCSGLATIGQPRQRSRRRAIESKRRRVHLHRPYLWGGKIH